MDSTAKAGGALVACAETSAPVIFIGTGEKLQDIETFNPTAFVSRLLGMGDLEGLLEKAKHAIDKEGCTILHLAVKNDNIELVEYALKIGLNPKQKALNGTAVDYAVSDAISTFLEDAILAKP